MQFLTEAFENVESFSGQRRAQTPVIWTDDEQSREAFNDAPLRRVADFTIEAENVTDVPEAIFEIANAPWQPFDVNGQLWDHQRYRSQCSGDVVLIHTPDGPVAYGCLFAGWMRLDTLPLSIVAALRMNAIKRAIANLLWPWKDAMDRDRSETVAKWARVLTGDEQEVVRGEFGGRERWLIKDPWCLTYRSKCVEVFDKWRESNLDPEQWANPNDFWNPA